MNIVRLLKDNRVVTKIRFYDINDMTTEYAVKNLMENKDLINEYFKKNEFKVTTIDEYIDYLYLRCMAQYEAIIPSIKEEIREEFCNQIAEIKDFFSKYQNRDLVLFLKDNYEQIFSEEYKGLFVKYDVIDYTIELLMRFYSKEEQIIKYIITNFSYKVYDNFDSFIKVFNNKENLIYYDILMSEELLKNDMTYRLNEIKKVLAILKKQSIDKYNEKIEIVLNLVKNENFNTNEAKVMYTYHVIKNMKKILAELEHKSFYEFEEELRKQEDILEKHLEKNGHSTKFEISIKPVVEIYEDEAKEWYQKSLIITHSLDKKNKPQLITNLEYSMKYFERSIIADLASTNHETNDIFTYSVINNLSISMMEGKYAINYMLLDDKRLNDLLSYIFAGVNKYFGYDSLYYNSEKFELDLNMLFNAILEFKSASNIKDDIKIKWLIYCIETQVCGIMEKILRNVFYEKTKEDKYINAKNATLGSLLASKEIVEVIGKNNCKCLEYYLLNCDGVGKNSRNDFSHYSDELYDKLIYDTILESLYLLLMISNILFIKSSKFRT